MWDFLEYIILGGFHGWSSFSCIFFIFGFWSSNFLKVDCKCLGVASLVLRGCVVWRSLVEFGTYRSFNFEGFEVLDFHGASIIILLILSFLWCNVQAIWFVELRYAILSDDVLREIFTSAYVRSIQIFLIRILRRVVLQCLDLLLKLLDLHLVCQPVRWHWFRVLKTTFAGLLLLKLLLKLPTLVLLLLSLFFPCIFFYLVHQSLHYVMHIERIIPPYLNLFLDLFLQHLDVGLQSI